MKEHRHAQAGGQLLDLFEMAGNIILIPIKFLGRVWRGIKLVLALLLLMGVMGTIILVISEAIMRGGQP